MMVTGSHNPPDYNGLKMVIDDTTLSGDDIQELARAHRARRSRDAARAPTARTTSATAYIDRIVVRREARAHA